MLKEIENIDWKNLKHAYGSAIDIPNDIRNLASQDQKIRERAIYNLYGNIFHQGSRYEATPYVIPFIYELLRNESTEDKHELFFLLISLALGYEEEYLPEGINPEKFRYELIQSESNLTAEQKEINDKYGYSATALINCYDFAKDGFVTLLGCLDSDDERISQAALYAISWFPEEADISIPKLTEKLSQTEGEIEIANAILAIGLLTKQSQDNFDLSVIHCYLKSDSELLRMCSAIALAKNPMDKTIVDVLIEGITSCEHLNYSERVLFNEGAIVGYASLTLSTYGKNEKEKIIPVLCQILESVNPYQSLDITYAILSIVNEKRTIPIKEEKLANLSQLEIKVLNSIYEYGGWTSGKSIFVNYLELLRSAGIHDSKQELGKFLNK